MDQCLVSYISNDRAELRRGHGTGNERATGGGGAPREGLVFGCEEKLARGNQKHKGAQIPGWIGAGCIMQSVAEPARIMVEITHIHSSNAPSGPEGTESLSSIKEASLHITL